MKYDSISLHCEIFHKVGDYVNILKLILEEEDWMIDGACRSSDTSLFFPVGSSLKAKKKAEEAIKICESCPVICQCLDYSIHTNQDAGIWGGKDEEQRKMIRRKYKFSDLLANA